MKAPDAKSPLKVCVGTNPYRNAAPHLRAVAMAWAQAVADPIERTQPPR
jgi:hypothetical protein